jgi:tetratricopeptide (TPR) repeat protein
VRIKFLSDHDGQPTVTALTGPVALDAQQALLLEKLRRAAGAPVSYDELREEGIQFPASVVSELELVGVRLERNCPVTPGVRPAVGVRLDPARDPAASLAAAPRGSGRSPAIDDPTSAQRAARASAEFEPLTLRERLAEIDAMARELTASALTRARGLPRIRNRSLDTETPSHGSVTTRRWLAPALTLVLAAAVLLVLFAGGGSDGHFRGSTQDLRAAAPRSAHRAGRGATAGSAQPRHATTPSPALATQFEARGHNLLESGHYASAIPLLREAIAATGEQLDRCLDPVSSACLTYAYALFDLGRAMQLTGQAATAVPILEQRLQIADQQQTVRSELALAQAQAD